MASGGKPTAREFFYNWALEDGDRFIHDIFDDELKSKFEKNFGNKLNLSDLERKSLRDKIADFSDTYSNHPGVNHNIQTIQKVNSGWIPSTYFDGIFAGVVRETDIAALSKCRDSDHSGKLVTYSIGMMHSAIFFADMFEFYLLPNQEHSLSSDIERNEFIFYILRQFNWWRLNQDKGELFETRHIYEKFQVEPTGWANVACAMADKFIIGHEIAHHLVGDTGYLPHVSEELDFIDGCIASLAGVIDRFFSDEIDRKELKADAVSLFLFLGRPTALRQCSAMDLNMAAIGTLMALGAMSILTDKGYDEIALSSQAMRRFMVMDGLITILVHEHKAETAEEQAIDKITLQLVTQISEFVVTILEHRRAWQAKLGPGEI